MSLSDCPSLIQPEDVEDTGDKRPQYRRMEPGNCFNVSITGIFDLPLETRQHIYSYVLAPTSSSTRISISPHTFKGAPSCQGLSKERALQFFPSERLPALFHVNRRVFTEAFRPYLEVNTLRLPDISLRPPYLNRVEGTRFLWNWLHHSGHTGAIRSVSFPDNLQYIATRGWNDSESLWKIIYRLVASLSGLKCVIVPIWRPYGVLAAGTPQPSRFQNRLQAIIQSALIANSIDLELRVVGLSAHGWAIRRQFEDWLEGQFPAGGSRMLRIQLLDCEDSGLSKFWTPV